MNLVFTAHNTKKRSRQSDNNSVPTVISNQTNPKIWWKIQSEVAEVNRTIQLLHCDDLSSSRPTSRPAHSLQDIRMAVRAKSLLKLWPDCMQSFAQKFGPKISWMESWSPDDGFDLSGGEFVPVLRCCLWSGWCKACLNWQNTILFLRNQISDASSRLGEVRDQCFRGILDFDRTPRSCPREQRTLLRKNRCDHRDNWPQQGELYLRYNHQC